jgi:hypothetical protein
VAGGNRLGADDGKLRHVAVRAGNIVGIAALGALEPRRAIIHPPARALPP